MIKNNNEYAYNLIRKLECHKKLKRKVTNTLK